jgi:hypothetical protein
MMKWMCFGALALGFLLAGCKKDEVTISTPEGTMTVSEEGGKTTLKTDDGKIEIEGGGDSGTMTMTDEKGNKVTYTGGKGVDPAELGVDLYPGAKIAEEQSALGKVETPEGTTLTVILSTADSVQKVIDYYKGKLKEAKPFMTDEAGMVTGQNAAGQDVTVTVSVDKDRKATMITMMTLRKK